jgi:catalase
VFRNEDSFLQGFSMKTLITEGGAPVVDNQTIQTAGPHGPALLQDVRLLEKLAHFDREFIPKRRMRDKGAGAHSTFTVTHNITRYTRAEIFSEVRKQTPMSFRRWPASATPADAEREIRATHIVNCIKADPCLRRGVVAALKRLARGSSTAIDASPLALELRS